MVAVWEDAAQVPPENRGQDIQDQDFPDLRGAVVPDSPLSERLLRRPTGCGKNGLMLS